MHYTTRAGEVSAVDNVSFDLAEGESLGLVGESGCGKTSIANSLLK
ncbi:MAG TPA: ATP-binding cassette domain-containing protein, partial [Anaerolineae bacterium]|nr:ATP-binding cassette domain-containing protein [Anaerolineae bacterium]